MRMIKMNNFPENFFTLSGGDLLLLHHSVTGSSELLQRAYFFWHVLYWVCLMFITTYDNYF